MDKESVYEVIAPDIITTGFTGHGDFLFICWRSVRSRDFYCARGGNGSLVLVAVNTNSKGQRVVNVKLFAIAMARIPVLLLTIGLASCSNKPILCVDDSMGCGVLYGASLISDIVTNTPSSKKCHEMTGEKKQRCLEQVEAVKAAIARQNKQ